MDSPKADQRTRQSTGVEGHRALFCLSVQGQKRRSTSGRQEAEVANVLEGSLRREGSHVRITAEVTKVADGFQLWSEEYNSDLKDVFAVQDEIARAVTGALQVKLLGAAATRPGAYVGRQSRRLPGLFAGSVFSQSRRKS